MKQDIENTIKKNLPENKHSMIKRMYDNGFDEALSQINTSLIADEVLKVVVENITKFAIYNYHNGERYIEFKEENLLSNLSTNKENKNNE